MHLERFAREAGQSLPPGASVLDAGAGHAPYRHHFAHCRYETADFAQINKPYAEDLTYVCDLANVPVAPARFDLVFMTQVLEHLPDPGQVLKEMHRVLRPGGRLWMTCPLYYEEHEQPFDFYRYTQFALRRLVTEAGFGDPRIDWLEGYLGTIGYQLDVAARSLPRGWRAVRAILRVLSELFARADVRWKPTARGHPKNYTVVAVA